jgi:hypothetical protein
VAYSIRAKYTPPGTATGMPESSSKSQRDVKASFTLPRFVPAWTFHQFDAGLKRLACEWPTQSVSPTGAPDLRTSRYERGMNWRSGK